MEAIGWLRKQLDTIEKEVKDLPKWKLGIDEENEQLTGQPDYKEIEITDDNDESYED